MARRSQTARSGTLTSPTTLRLLATKLFVPRPRHDLVARPRLLAQLDSAVGGLLTVLAAPAGWGKTTVAATWCATVRPEELVAWVSLDAGDNDPVRFWAYVLTALEQARPGVAEDARRLLYMSQPPAIEAALTLLLNAVGTLTADVVLVLDDYHLITAAAVHTSVTYLLEHAPPQLHLVVASREDPPLPLARMRASGSVCELRAADLRFTSEEAGAFLTQAAGVLLPAKAIEALETRTEGWIAGLQLAALSVQGHSGERASEFIATFGGSHRYIVDYLVEEVLARQPPEVQTFLLRTAVLDRFCAPLCDVLLANDGDVPSGAVQGVLHAPLTQVPHAVPSTSSSSRPHRLSTEAILERVERANLFLIPLDDERHWYRYHHLFADVLRSRLRQANPSLYAELHRRASRWFEKQDLVEEAVGHALAAADFEQAAILLDEKHAVEKALREARFETVLGWLRALPEPVMQSRLPLCILHAIALTETHQFDHAEARVRDVEAGIARETLAWQRAHPACEGLPDELRAMQAIVAIFRATRAVVTGEVDHGVALAREAIEHLPVSDSIWRTTAAVAMALEYQVSGDVSPAAEQHVAASVLAARAAADPPQMIFALLAVQGNIQLVQGRLRQAIATFHEAERVAAPLHREGVWDSHFYELGLGEVLRQWNDLDAAERRLLRCVDERAGHLTLNAELLTHGYTALARLYQARGEHLQALRILDHVAETAQKRGFTPDLVEWQAAVRAQLALAAGDVQAAALWADTSGLSVDDQELPFRREPAYLALARVRIAQGRSNPGGPYLRDAERLLAWLLADGEAKGRGRSVLEILVLRALAHQARRDTRGALGTLTQALRLAQPESYVRLFADEGVPMATLLTELIEAVKQRRLAVPQAVLDYAQLLLAICRSSDGDTSLPMPPVAHSLQDSAGGSYHSALSVPPLLDPLTERELEVLRLLAEGASNRDIAAKLVVAVGTVKKHVYNVCSKLGAQNRTQAVARARALHLL